MKPAVTMLLAIIALLLPGGVAALQDERQQSRPQPSVTAMLPTLFDLSEAPAGYTLEQLEFFEKYCFTEVNRYREAQNLAPLVYLPEVLPIARCYSRRMAEEGFFSHTDPQGATAKERLLQIGIKYAILGENLSRASGYLDPVPDVVKGWAESPQHRVNIVNPQYKYAAAGAWIKDQTFFFTEIFLNR